MRTAIYGIGNILMGDDGIGPAVIAYLKEHYTFPDNVTVEDLGTPSLDLPTYLHGYDLVLFIDAVTLDAPPGTIRVFSREEILAVQPGIRISPHEPSITDALRVLEFAGGGPGEVVLVGVVPAILEGGSALSAPVEAAVSEAFDVVFGEFAKRTESQSRPCTTTFERAERSFGPPQLGPFDILDRHARLGGHALGAGGVPYGANSANRLA